MNLREFTYSPIQPFTHLIVISLNTFKLTNNSSTLSLFGRIIFTAVMLSIIYLFLGPVSYVEADAVNEAFYLLIVAPVLVIGTILFSFLIGAPIRMIPSFFKFWYDRPYICLILLVTGIALCLLSTESHFIVSETRILNREDIIEQRPNFKMLCAGWFTVAFSATHFYFSSCIILIKRKTGSIKKTMLD